MQKVIFVLSHLQQSGLTKHAKTVEIESEELDKYLSDGWKVVSITPANLGGAVTHYGFAYAVVIEK